MMPMRKPQKQQNKQKIKFIKIRKNPDIEGEAVFHRAFDCIDNQDSAAEKLIRLGADRILTSGGAVNVWDGRKQLKHLQNQYGKDITILAGSGVNDTNVRALIEYTGITQVHSSCGSWMPEIPETAAKEPEEKAPDLPPDAEKLEEIEDDTDDA